MKTPLTLLALAGLLTLPSANVYAEKADRNKPMNVEADLYRNDNVRQVQVLAGNVLITKGTLQIRGDQVELREDPQGFQHGVATGNPSKLAFFRQKREGVDEYFEGEAEVLTYNSRSETVTLKGRAQLRRYRGATLADEIVGGLIVYHSLTDLFTVDGASTGRVRATLIPKPEATK